MYTGSLRSKIRFFLIVLVLVERLQGHLEVISVFYGIGLAFAIRLIWNWESADSHFCFDVKLHKDLLLPVLVVLQVRTTLVQVQVDTTSLLHFFLVKNVSHWCSTYPVHQRVPVLVHVLVPGSTYLHLCKWTLHRRLTALLLFHASMGFVESTTCTSTSSTCTRTCNMCYLHL